MGDSGKKDKGKRETQKKALLDPKANWRGFTTTTATSAVLVIVNGPIIYEIGLCENHPLGAFYKLGVVGLELTPDLFITLQRVLRRIGGIHQVEKKFGSLDMP